MKDILFKKVDYALSKLIEDIDLGEIGLPDIQRPFIWNPGIDGVKTTGSNLHF